MSRVKQTKTDYCMIRVGAYYHLLVDVFETSTKQSKRQSITESTDLPVLAAQGGSIDYFWSCHFLQAYAPGPYGDYAAPPPHATQIVYSADGQPYAVAYPYQYQGK